MKLLFWNLVILLQTVYSCYTIDDVQTNGYTTYGNKVYDISNYKHPGGSKTLSKAIGKPLEIYFNQKAYDFHINDKSTDNDLLDIEIGILCDPEPTDPETDPTEEPTDPPTKTTKISTPPNCIKNTTTTKKTGTTPRKTITTTIPSKENVNNSNNLSFVSIITIQTLLTFFVFNRN